MPAMTKCPKCKFDGPHGFVVSMPYMTKFYHGECSWYSGLGKVFRTFKSAVTAVHKEDSSRYDGLWVVYMLSKSPSREKLPRLHSKRCSGVGLSKSDLVYIKSKGIKI